MRAALVSVAKKEGNGVFGIACVAHEFLGGRFISEDYEIPMNSGMMATNATSDWINNKGNSTHIDDLHWPDNKPCAHKAVSYLPHLQFE